MPLVGHLEAFGGPLGGVVGSLVPLGGLLAVSGLSFRGRAQNVSSGSPSRAPHGALLGHPGPVLARRPQVGRAATETYWNTQGRGRSTKNTKQHKKTQK